MIQIGQRKELFMNKDAVNLVVVSSDIDRTEEGALYVVYEVDGSGWVWFALGIVALIPVVYMGFALHGAADFISTHPLLVIFGYILLTSGVGAAAYKRKTGLWNPIGMLATTLSFLPVLLTEMLVEVPGILRTGDSIGGMIELLIEWIFLTLIVAGIGVFIHAVSMLSFSPIRHLIMGIVYCAVVGLILAKTLDTEKIIELKSVYGIIF